MYLFEDAAKQKRDKLFCESRYSDICSKFETEGLKVFTPAEIAEVANHGTEDEQTKPEPGDAAPSTPPDGEPQ